MRVLIACEYSGIVRDAFIEKGHDAMSCDLLSTEKPGPHYKGDVFDVIDNGWDLMIAHPPCQHLAVSGAAWFKRKRESGEQREAIELFMKLYNAPIPKICIENPINIIGGKYIQKHFPDLCDKYGLPIQPSQKIEPYYFGDPVNKKTSLWLRGLPELKHNPKDYCEGSKYIESPSGRRYPEWCWNTGGGSGKQRSKFFEGIAKAMADQWFPRCKGSG